MSEALPVNNVSRIGSIVEGKYEILRLLGAGGMGEVYEARHLQISRRVALKFLLREVAGEPSLLQRFRNEARAGGALQHENVAAVYDVGVAADGIPYIVMEFLEGRDCAAELESVGTFHCWRAVHLIIQVCRGLAMAHTHGIIHRDLKPANLFLSRRADGSELVKILDFGIAKLQRSPPTDHSTGAIFGTPFYMSPERARGDRTIDHRSDIYALGVILYELLSGERPYDGTSALQILHGILTRDPAPLDEVRRDVPIGLCEIVHRAMAREPEDRFATVAELEEALSPFASFGTSLTAARVADLEVTMPERESEPASQDDSRGPITLVQRATEQLARLAGVPPERLQRFGRIVAWIVVAFAATGFVLGTLRVFGARFERAKVVKPETAIDRPDDRSVPPPAETSRVEQPSAAVVAPDAPPAAPRESPPPSHSSSRRSTRPTQAPAAASTAPRPGSEAAPTGPAKTHDLRRLEIDRESPYR